MQGVRCERRTYTIVKKTTRKWVGKGCLDVIVFERANEFGIIFEPGTVSRAEFTSRKFLLSGKMKETRSTGAEDDFVAGYFS